MTRREALHTLATGTSADVLAGGAVVLVAPAPAAEPIGADLAAAIERFRVTEAAFADVAEVYGQLEEAVLNCRTNLAARSALKEMEVPYGHAGEALIEAIEAILALPITSLADMRAKAAFVSPFVPSLVSDTDKAMALLLQSMGADRIGASR